MEWYRATAESFELNRLSLDLVSVHLCGSAHVCERESVSSVRGMYPSLAAVTLWSSLGFAALVGFQAGARLLAGGAIDVFTKLGYMLALMAISLAVATAYVFGPEVSDVRIVASAWADIALHRTWAPATLIAGLSIGFIAIYLAVSRESSDPAAAYKPVKPITIDPAAAAAGSAAAVPAAAAASAGRRLAIPFPVPPGEQTDFLRGGAKRESTAVTRNEHLPQPGGRREQTPTGQAPPTPTQPVAAEAGPSSSTLSTVETREQTGILHAAHPQTRPPAAPNRDSNSTMRAARPAVQPLLAMRRELTPSGRIRPPTQPIGSGHAESTDALRIAGPPTQPDAPPITREQTGTGRIPGFREPTGALRVAGAREQTGNLRVAGPPTQPDAQPMGREPTGRLRASDFREQTGTRRAPDAADPMGPPRASDVRDQTLRGPGATDQTANMRAAASREHTGTLRTSDFREPTGTRRVAAPPGQTGQVGQTGPSRAVDARNQTLRGAGSTDPITSTRATASREQTGTLRAAGPTTQPSIASPAVGREQTGTLRAAGFREQTGTLRAAGFRQQTGTLRALGATDPGIGVPRTRTGSLPPIPDHLRNRLRYVALTAEMTGGGIDARREDGLSRLVLWRDVVGVVARRMPPAYDGAAFVDIVSTAGSTLRIVPWTRLTGQLTDLDGGDRTRAVVEHVVAQCPSVRLDPATRMFLDTGVPAQLPDLDTLRAHDERLA
ncbi:MAG TPA: hypothetical protein VHW23_17155 [Kofleriaceae bacterium]|nr:hypothetical protein [Kofleriaceae bacterium]